MKKLQITPIRILAIFPFWLLSVFSLHLDLTQNLGYPNFLAATLLTFCVATMVSFIVLTGEGG